MPQKYPYRNQLKYTRKPYRVRNWKEYEAGLRRRGDLTIWFSEDALGDWHPVPPTLSSRLILLLFSHRPTTLTSSPAPPSLSVARGAAAEIHVLQDQSR